jgi:hypothetical protein
VHTLDWCKCGLVPVSSEVDVLTLKKICAARGSLARQPAAEASRGRGDSTGKI